MRLAVLSNSFDASAAIVATLVEQRGGSCFQLHTDLFTDYSIEFRLDEVAIADPGGNEMRLSEIDALYVRKPWKGGAHPELKFADGEHAFVRGQFHAITDELIALARQQGKLRLVEPATAKRCSKFVQMRTAREYFTVPEALLSLNKTLSAGRVVTKTLAAELIQGDKFLFVDVVDAAELDPAYPWFTQELVVGDYDIAAVFVGGQVFWFQNEQPRENANLDWRQTINTDDEPGWVLREDLNKHDVAVRAFMSDLGLFFGRLDFIIDKGALRFLEVNPNGQYAWLDIDPPHTIHHRVVDCLADRSFAVF